MVVLRALVDSQLLDHLSAEGILGEHALDRLIDGKIAALRHEFPVRDLFETADIARVITVVFIFEFFAREKNFIAVDDDYKIARVDVRGEGGLVFSAQNGGDLTCPPTTGPDPTMR